MEYQLQIEHKESGYIKVFYHDTPMSFVCDCGVHYTAVAIGKDKFIGVAMLNEKPMKVYQSEVFPNLILIH